MTPLLYRVFCIPLTVFFLLSLMPQVQAQGNSLMVKGVTVDITADSALGARNKAFTEARKLAYQQLAAQYVPADDLAGLVIPSDQILSSMVKDFEIVSEKMTTHRYVGTMDVRFNPAVRGSFQTQSASVSTPVSEEIVAQTGLTAGTISQNPPIITGSDTTRDDYVYSPSRGNIVTSSAAVPQVQTARPTLILPWYGPRGRQTLWSQENPWRDAWEASANLSRDKSMPIILPVGDVDDVRDYSPAQALSSRGDVNALMQRYRASDAVLAIAEPAEGGALIVSLYRFEGGSPVAMGRFGVDAGSGESRFKSAVERALVSMRAMPMGSGSAVTPASISTAETVVQTIPTTPNAMYFVALARFNGLSQWVAIRNALTNTPGIQSVDVQSISPTQAQVQFAFNGDGGSLSALLTQRGLQIAPLSTHAQASVPGSMVPQYELTSLRSY